MRLLLIHAESKYFGGAETMLDYFLSSLESSGCEVAVAAVPQCRMAARLPGWVRKFWITDCTRFSVANLFRQAWALRRFRREFDYQVVHGWAARDWDLTALVARLARRLAAGTLHDHPRSFYIRPQRQALMRGCARWGLRRIVCVSDAVRQACLEAGYPPTKLTVIHNGLPITALPGETSLRLPIRLGYLGAFTEVKGFDLLFEILEELDRQVDGGWVVRLAGKAPDAQAEALVARLRRQYAPRRWWPQVQWTGWAEKPIDFLRTTDALIFPSMQFDSFPSVLLEAGMAGVPAVASRIGGVPEIVDDGATGWLFEPGDRRRAAAQLAELVRETAVCRKAGLAARNRIHSRFDIGGMVAEYLKMYSELVMGGRHVCRR